MKNIEKAHDGDWIPMASVRLGEQEIEAVSDVLRSGNLRSGDRCAEFETRFAERVGATYAVSVNSGTAALHVSALALLEPGAEVLVPSFTFIASASAMVLAGARPVLVDVDPLTLTMDPEDARRKIGARTKAMVPVHLYGNAADVPSLQTLARAHDLRLIWDAAQAFGTRHGGRDVGSLEDVVCYSFYPTKTITTGEGGMITTNSRELYERCKLLRSHYDSGRYEHTGIGLNYRSTDIAAAIGLVQLDRADEYLARRRTNAETLAQILEGVPGIHLPVVQRDSVHSWNLFTIQVDALTAGVNRDALAARLREKGVDTAIHYPRPLHRQLAMARFAPFDDLEDSELASDRVLSLPIHPGLCDSEVVRVADAVRDIVQAARS